MALDRSGLSDALRNWHVCVITDLGLGRGRSHVEIAAAALAGGADAIQLRDKDAEGRELFETACAIRELTRVAGAAFVVNDRVDLALAVGADAVHVGQKDLPAREVRRLIGWDMVLGISASNPDEARRALEDGADYLGVGPIFDATATKSDAAPPMGTHGLAELRARSQAPILAIGGIDHGNAEAVIRAGADGLAVISCIVGAVDIAAAVRDLHARVVRAKR